MSLNGDGTVASEQKISTNTGGFSGDRLGATASVTKDLNADGVPELLNGVAGANKTWILYLNSDGTVADEEAIAEGSGGFDGAISDSDKFGSSAAPIGDIDGDNTLDLLAGATGTDDKGAVWTLFGGSYPLPVELTQFDARLDGTAVQLSWTTASETNNSGFAVQRRVGDSWRSIGFVESTVAGGTTTQSQSYQFRDAALPFDAERVQYRLKQVDLDGTTSVSAPTVVERRDADAPVLNPPRPNPANQTATVEVELPDAADDAHLVLYNLLGQQVRRIPLSPSSRQTKTLDTGTLSSGTYLLQLNAGGGSVRTERLTVVH